MAPRRRPDRADPGGAALGYAYAAIGGAAGATGFYEQVCGAFVIPGSDRGVYGASRA